MQFLCKRGKLNPTCDKNKYVISQHSVLRSNELRRHLGDIINSHVTATLYFYTLLIC